LAEKLEAFGKQPRETVAKVASDDEEEAQQGDKGAGSHHRGRSPGEAALRILGNGA
jgi:hypothetical protein